MKYLFLSMRPKQWVKNVLLFAGLVFSKNVFQPALLLRSIAGFGIFCALSGAVYLINDLLDLKQDRVHPLKSKRPLASGKLSPSTAIAAASALMIAGLAVGFVLDAGFGGIALLYTAMNIGYTLFLKHVVILDIVVIAIGFVMRAVAGAELIHVYISSWLLVCTLFFALFLSLGKRRHELVLLGEGARSHRPILSEYSPYLLDQMISVVTASTIMAYTLYTTSAETVEKFGTRNLILTTPFVLYGIFRYLYLIHQKKLGGRPEQILLEDRALLIDVFAYLVATGIILYRT